MSPLSLRQSLARLTVSIAYASSLMVCIVSESVYASELCSAAHSDIRLRNVASGSAVVGGIVSTASVGGVANSAVEFSLDELGFAGAVRGLLDFTATLSFFCGVAAPIT